MVVYLAVQNLTSAYQLSEMTTIVSKERNKPTSPSFLCLLALTTCVKEKKIEIATAMANVFVDKVKCYKWFGNRNGNQLFSDLEPLHLWTA